MNPLLEKLNAIPGVLGSMVMTDDGIPVASRLSEEIDEECVAAFSSTARLAVNRAAMHCSGEVPEEVILEAEGGNLLLMNLEGATLAVMTHAGLELNTGLLEIRSIARRLSGILEIRIS